MQPRARYKETVSPYSTGQAFELLFRSRHPLTELSSGTGQAAPDSVVDLDWCEPAPDRPPDLARDVPFHVSGGTFHLQVPGIASYSVTANRIAITPESDAADSSIRAFLFGSAIGALLQMRGLTVLHGSAVGLPDGGAAVFCGQSTAGKSTLAAALAARGHPALADDITAIRLDADGQGWCLPGLARTKLWRDALQHLGLEHRVDDGTRVMPDMDKHSLSVVTADAPMPLRRFYELQAIDGGELAVTPVTGIAKLHTLLAHAYRPHFLQAMGRQGDLLRSAAALVPRLDMQRIVRPRQGQTLDAIVAQLEQQWRA